MDGDRDLEFLVKNDFCKLGFELQLKIKQSGRPTPKLDLTQRRASGVARFFCDVNYSRTEWLAGSAKLNRLFCWPCLLFDRSRGSFNNPWRTTGFVDLANLARAIARHSVSRSHISSELKLRLFGRVVVKEEPDQAAAIDVTRHNLQVDKNRAVLKRLIVAALYLARREQASRGHGEAVGSSGTKANFVELVQAFAEFDTTLAEHQASATAFMGTSNSTLDDIVLSAAHVIQEEIDREVCAAPFIAVEVDDTTDVSCQCQLTVIVRYVNDRGAICERFLGFYDTTPDRDAEATAAVVLRAVAAYSPETKLICQTYDGASGLRGGVPSLVKAKCPHALFIHSYAHTLPSVLAQGTRNIQESKLFFASLGCFHDFFGRSSKRAALLAEVDSRVRPPGGGAARWSFQSRPVHAVHEGRASLIVAFERIANEPGWDSDAVAQSAALRHRLEDFDFVFMLQVFRAVSDLTEPLVQALRSDALDVRACDDRASGALEALRVARSSEMFTCLYEKTVQTVGIPNQLHKRSRRAREGPEPGVGTDGNQEDTGPMDSYRRLFFQLLDGIVQHLTQRFKDMKNLYFFHALDHRLFKTYSHPAGFPDLAVSRLLETYPLFDELRLKNELQVLYADPLFHRPPAELLEMLITDELTTVLSEVCKLLRLMLTVPLTSPSAGGSYSCLQRIHTYLRNTRGQERLDHFAKISLESSITQDLKSCGELYARVTERFATTGQRINEFTEITKKTL